MIRFRVNGVPAPQGSKRHVGNGRMVEMSKRVGPWRDAVRAEAIRALDNGRRAPTQEPVSVTLVFVLARPKTAPPRPYPSVRPDLDKLARSTLDGLVMGGIMADDSQVVSLNCAKVYASNGEAPGAIIEVEAL